ncbi:hypothetical protein B7L09_02495 [Pseudomonas mandelii]|uniref:hypothetical protein n=1 Tax=Pseudomonas mandelii TaxID=75612 RepID=UPI000B969A8A|nr:hypothetical protein [Pseudomonas mandelii]OYQ28876.1 hypothetical protein B7L09_02495 [Pseudomonas mandelii]
MGEPQLELVKPIVLGEQDGALEPGDLPGGIGKLTAPRPTVKPTQSGDIVTYTWTGEVTGTTEDSVTLNGLSKDKDVNFTLNATFVAEHIEPNRGKKVTVSYRIWRAATSETSYSNVLEFGVGQAIGQLLPPAVKEADGGTRLDPLNAQTHLTAVVNYDGMLVGDQITAIWTGADGTLPEGSHTTAPWPVTTLGPQEIPLEPKVVAFSLGKAVTVNYKVTRGSSSPMPSDTLTLSVLPLPENVLDKPLILQAADNGEGAEFDVSQLTDNAVIQVNAWPFIALKQFVWLRVQGTNNDDSPYAQTFWQPPLSQTNETWITLDGLVTRASIEWLKTLKDGSEVTIAFKVSFDKVANEATTVSFPLRTYTIKAVADVKPAIIAATNSNGDEIAEGEPTVDTSITLTGTASKGQQVDVLDGAVSKGQATADLITGVWTLLVSGLSVAAHSFTAKALYGSGQSSAPRTLTVTAVIVPTISAAKGSPSGVEIPHGGVNRSVTVTGKASPNQKVRLLDGTTSLGEPTANGSGIWTQVVSALTVKAYSLKALALYGEGEESAPPFTFTVAAALKPAIDLVTDSKGPVAQGGITFDRSVTVTGKASPNQKVRLLDGTTSLGEPTANGSGIWTQVVSALTVKAYSLKALALYGEGEESAPPFTFTVAAALKPAIDLVTDSKGPVAQGGTTFDRSVTVTGKASPNQKVRLLDGTTSLGEPTANGSGIWTQVVSALTVKAYSLKALALYGEGEESAAPRTLTVTAVIVPTISAAKGSPSGVEIPHGGVTPETAVTFTGTASKGQKVEVFDGAVSKGQATADLVTGIWTLLVSGLSVAAHSFTAKALYGSGQSSWARTLTVTALIAPTLSSVKGSTSRVEIHNGGTTFETSVTLTGTASKGQKVQVLDGITPKGQSTADTTTGIWTLTDTGLALGPHSFTAKALYGSEPTSAARTFEIKPFIDFEDFQSLASDFIPINGTPLETPAIFLSVVQADSYALIERFPNDSLPGKLEGQCIQGLNARVRLELKAPVSQVSFWHWVAQCTAVIYGVGGEVLGEEALESSQSVKKSTFTFSGIKRIELIFRKEYCFVDTFSFTL